MNIPTPRGPATRRRRGAHRRSAPHKLAHFGTAHLGLGTTPGAKPAFAPSSDLTKPAPHHMNQGATATCGGHALSVFLAIAFALSRISPSFAGPPSPRGVYAATLRIEQPGAAPLRDTGVEPADPFLAIARVGIRGMEVELTPDGRRSDVWGPDDVVHVEGAPPPNVSDRPTAAEDVACAANLVSGAGVIEPSDPWFLELVAASLSQDKPVAACIFADHAFEDWGDEPGRSAGAALAGHPNFADEHGGGHYVVVVGHRTEADGSLSFLIWNSWGDEWGVPSGEMPDEAGNIWVTGAWFRESCSEAFAGALTIRSAA